MGEGTLLQGVACDNTNVRPGIPLVGVGGPAGVQLSTVGVPARAWTQLSEAASRGPAYGSRVYLGLPKCQRSGEGLSPIATGGAGDPAYGSRVYLGLPKCQRSGEGLSPIATGGARDPAYGSRVYLG